MSNCFDIAYTTEQNFDGLPRGPRTIHVANESIGVLIDREPDSAPANDSYAFKRNCIIPAAIQTSGNVNIIIMNNYGQICEPNDTDTIYCEPAILCHDLDGNTWCSGDESETFFQADVIFEIPIEVLDEIIDSKTTDDEKNEDKEVIGRCGDWILTYDEETEILTATNQDSTVQGNSERLKFDMKFNEESFYTIYSTYKDSNGGNEKSYCAGLTKIENETNVGNDSVFYRYTDSANAEKSWYAALLIAYKPVSRQLDQSKTAFRYVLENMSESTKQEIYLQFSDPLSPKEDVNDGKRGESKPRELILYDNDTGFGELRRNLKVNANGNIIRFNISKLFRNKYSTKIDETEIELRKEDNEFKFQFQDAKKLKENELKFYTALFKYSKPIIMFLILVVIMFTGIYSIMNSQDPKARALVKEKIKHILVGVVMFMCVVLILWICKAFMEANFAKIEEVAQVDIESSVDAIESEINQSWLVKNVVSVIEAIRLMMNWLIDSILKR